MPSPLFVFSARNTVSMNVFQMFHGQTRRSISCLLWTSSTDLKHVESLCSLWMNLCVTVQRLFHSHLKLGSQGKRLCSLKALRPDIRDIVFIFSVVILIDRKYISDRRPLLPHFHLWQLPLKHDFKQQFTIDLDIVCLGNKRISRYLFLIRLFYYCRTFPNTWYLIGDRTV